VVRVARTLNGLDTAEARVPAPDSVTP